MMMNPIFESSARRRKRTGRTPVILTVYMMVLLVFSVSALRMFFGQGTTVGQMRKSTEWYIWLTALEFLLIVLVAPALSAGSIAGERERQTFDLLMVSGVGVRRIVTGKLMENFAFLILIILCSVPVMALAGVTGGVSLGQILVTTVYLMIIALEALCIGLFASCLCKRSLTAILVSYLGVFLLGVGAWALAKHGPLAAAYTSQSLRAFASMHSGEILLGMPSTIFFCPAVGLLTMLAHQTGILHHTMENTFRLYHIYLAAKAAGFGISSLMCFCASCLSSCLFWALAVLTLYLQSGGIAIKKR